MWRGGKSRKVSPSGGPRYGRKIGQHPGAGGRVDLVGQPSRTCVQQNGGGCCRTLDWATREAFTAHVEPERLSNGPLTCTEQPAEVISALFTEFCNSHDRLQQVRTADFIALFKAAPVPRHSFASWATSAGRWPVQLHCSKYVHAPAQSHTINVTR